MIQSDKDKIIKAIENGLLLLTYEKLDNILGMRDLFNEAKQIINNEKTS